MQSRRHPQLRLRAESAARFSLTPLIHLRFLSLCRSPSSIVTMWLQIFVVLAALVAFVYALRARSFSQPTVHHPRAFEPILGMTRAVMANFDRHYDWKLDIVSHITTHAMRATFASLSFGTVVCWTRCDAALRMLDRCTVAAFRMCLSHSACGS